MRSACAPKKGSAIPTVRPRAPLASSNTTSFLMVRPAGCTKKRTRSDMASIWTGLTRSIGCIPMCEIAGDEQEAIERKTACTARNQEALADWERFPFKLEVQPPPNKCGYMDHREGCDCKRVAKRCRFCGASPLGYFCEA